MGVKSLLPTYLEKVWEVVGRSALAQVLGTAEAKRTQWCGRRRRGGRAAHGTVPLDAAGHRR